MAGKNTEIVWNIATLSVGFTTQELKDGLMKNSLISDLTWITIGALIGVCIAAITSIAIKSSLPPSPKPKDYILHSITADGTEFYVYMNEEQYGKWISENHIKIKKLKLQQ